ncbi:MAG TPA: hypothetical protein VEG08_01190 [Terriglobales bacterium]|nr:hypothetical protein [Terriglobales bacterium]
MTTARVLYHLVRADFLERVRRRSFLLILGFAAWLGYLAAVGRIMLNLGEYRGVYNSAWIGALMALVTTSFLSLAGFYMVKNAIDRDEQTRVGQILAATPMSKPFYTLAKALSNFVVLAAMVGVLGVAAVAMQLARGEDPHLRLWPLLSPFLLIAVPGMAVTAALAVLFESISWLRRGLGNVVYFFLWTTLLALSAGSNLPDFAGIDLFMNDMGAGVRAVASNYKEAFTLELNVGGVTLPPKRFVWNGLHWSAGMVGGRLAWLVIAVFLALLAAVFFHRFDPARERRRGGKGSDLEPAAEENGDTHLAPVHLTPLPPAQRRFPFSHLVLAEVRLMLKGRSRWWYLVALGLWLGTLLSPLEAARQVLAFAWIWPVLLWSAMGMRESRFATDALVFSCAHSLRRQLPAAWLAGVLLAAITGSGGALRFLLGGHWVSLLAWGAAVLFIPSFALACGVWSGGSKLFEAIFTIWWYVGPVNHAPEADFVGVSPSPEVRISLFYAGAAVILLGLAFLGRRRQLYRNDGGLSLSRPASAT